jgi:hypothetical protein
MYSPVIPKALQAKREESQVSKPLVTFQLQVSAQPQQPSQPSLAKPSIGFAPVQPQAVPVAIGKNVSVAKPQPSQFQVAGAVPVQARAPSVVSVPSVAPSAVGIQSKGIFKRPVAIPAKYPSQVAANPLKGIAAPVPRVEPKLQPKVVVESALGSKENAKPAQKIDLQAELQRIKERRKALQELIVSIVVFAFCCIC